MGRLKEKKGMWIIVLLSIVVPVLVAILYVIPTKTETDFGILPHINAFINGATFLTVIAAVVAIKNGNRKRHELLMWSALGLSTLFLIFYVLYHGTTPTTPFGGEGWIRYVYFFILITHIVLSAVIVPLILVTLLRALNERFDKHKKIAKIAFPIWLYVSLTGVIVYFMIAPYYG